MARQKKIKMYKIGQEIQDLVIKIIIPALVAISIKLAVESRRGKISFFNAITSIIIGVGCAYLSSGWVMDVFSHGMISIVIAVITLTGEKIAFWLIYKLNIDIIGDFLINTFLQYLKKLFGNENK